jgi:chemotaxis protein methyltransferase CheR
VPEDPWALAVILREEGLFERSTVYATDPDQERVIRAERGEFPRSHFSTSQEAYTAGGGRAILEEYFAGKGPDVRMRALLRDKIVFSQHDPRCEASFNEFQLVLCRPGWTREDEARVTGVLEASLCRFGVVGFIAHDPPRSLSRVTGYEAITPRLLRRVR